MKDVGLPGLKLSSYSFGSCSACKRIYGYVLFLVDYYELGSAERGSVLVDLENANIRFNVGYRDEVNRSASARYRSVCADGKCYLPFVEAVTRGSCGLAQIERTGRKLENFYVSVGLPLVHSSSEGVGYPERRSLEELSALIELCKADGVGHARIRKRYRYLLVLVDNLKSRCEIRHIRAVRSALGDYASCLCCVHYGVRRLVYVPRLGDSIRTTDRKLREGYALASL